MAYTGNAYLWTAESLGTFNDVGGVYWIVQPPVSAGGAHRVIYVGRTDSFKRRLPEHFNDRSDCIWKYGPSHVYAEVIATDAARIAREKAEIIAYQRISQAPCNEKVG